MNSRYYDPELGRFINGDDANFVFCANSVEVNLFTYGDCCPVIYYDPHGFKAIDITKKLTNLMRKNAINFMWYIIKKICSKGLALGIIDVFKYFYNNSKTNGSWDLKNQGWKLSSKDFYVFKGLKLRQDDPGNIHFGYVGSVLFSLTTLKAGAGVYQLYSKTSKWYYVLSYFDDPRDSTMIGIGHYLFIADILKIFVLASMPYLWVFKKIAKKLWLLHTKYHPKKTFFI